MTHKLLYKPFNKKTQYLASVNVEGEIVELESILPKYKIKIKPKGYIPKTGCVVVNAMQYTSFKGLTTLDIGTGESGLLALNMAASGAKKTIAIDVDNEAIKWAKFNAKLNHLEKKVIFKKISLGDYKTNIVFDVVTANLPQMPSNSIGSSHDDGGPDGRKFINQAIKFCSRNLKINGKLYITALDFLGVEKKLNNNNTILDSFKKAGFRAKVVKRQLKKIIPGSYTSQKLSWIKTKYPLYDFHPTQKSMGEYYILIVEAIKIN